MQEKTESHPVAGAKLTYASDNKLLRILTA